MDKKTCLITGANSGIGKQAAIQLAQAGFYVFLGVRDLQRGEEALKDIKLTANTNSVELILLDMSSRDAIASASETLHKKIKTLDVLIHNAATFDIGQNEKICSVDGVETLWATNHIGPIALTINLLPLLKNSRQGRIITIASKGLIVHPLLKVHLADPEFNLRKFKVSKAYYQSKLAQVMYTYWLAKELSTSSVTANCIYVSNVKIDLDRYPNVSFFMKQLYKFKSQFSILPEEMARTYTHLATAPELISTSGCVFNENKEEILTSRYSKNQDNIDAVMKMSMQYV